MRPGFGGRPQKLFRKDQRRRRERCRIGQVLARMSNFTGSLASRRQATGRGDLREVGVVSGVVTCHQVSEVSFLVAVVGLVWIGLESQLLHEIDEEFRYIQHGIVNFVVDRHVKTGKHTSTAMLALP